MSHILVTGVAGFIGFHTAKKLLEAGENVCGIDNLNDYYDVSLKEARVAELQSQFPTSQFSFLKQDLCDREGLSSLFSKFKIKVVINLAAQAGVRYSLQNPYAYLKSNLEGFLNLMECVRHNKVTNFIFASSSSVYGSNQSLPFSESQNVDHPISLYAATKKSNELIAHSYSHLFQIPCTGLRFFTVYGPWGRPDMAMFLFADAISKNKPLKLFNGGEMLRDFTYVDDVVESIVRLCEKPTSYEIFNIGNHSPVKVKEVVSKIEAFFGKKALIIHEPMQAGDVEATYADVDRLYEYVGFRPKTSLDNGLHAFLTWFQKYRSI